MKGLFIACVAVGVFALLASAARADDRNGPDTIDTDEFATLPQGVRYPEGITANPASGDIFVSTFDTDGTHANKLVRFNRSGRVEAQRDFGAQGLLGLGFANGKVYILNFGASKLQRIAASFDSGTPLEDVAMFPVIGTSGSRTVGNPDGSSDTLTFGSNGFPAPNAMVFDRAGNLYVSDSFQGAIYRIAHATTCTAPCPVTVVSHDPLLATAGFPPFGANGLALNADESALFIAITGDNRVLKMALPSAAISVFAESIHGADGLLFANGRLWVAANQGDSILALNDKGRVTIRAGQFEGINRDGTPRGLLFPASMVIQDGYMYVSNLALPLTPMVGDEPEEDVTRWTVSRFRMPR
jgi:DNA-binding beta-propeller fold protein YncE